MTTGLLSQYCIQYGTKQKMWKGFFFDGSIRNMKQVQGAFGPTATAILVSNPSREIQTTLEWKNRPPSPAQSSPAAEKMLTASESEWEHLEVETWLLEQMTIKRALCVIPLYHMFKLFVTSGAFQSSKLTI